LKQEYGLGCSFWSKKQDHAAVGEAVFLYNTKRPQLSLTYKTPEKMHRRVGCIIFCHPISGLDSEDILAGSGLSAMVDGVDLDKTGECTLQRGVEGTDRDAVFEEVAWFGERFAFEGESGLVFSKGTVDGSGTYGQEFSFDVRRDTEGRLLGDSVHLLPHKRSQELY
jgi:hypothetical protein